MYYKIFILFLTEYYFIFQIISTYQTPDHAELEYHAVVMLRRNMSFDGFSFFAKHTGVQFLVEEEEEEYSHDVLLAALLYYICTKGSISIDRMRFDTASVVCKEVAHLVSTHSQNGISYEFANDAFCEESKNSVMLHCLCKCPWIDGSTARALFNNTNCKKFNMHCCCRCSTWYHFYCLEQCKVKLPKRTEDYICPTCFIPRVLEWKHPKYTNTCTSDNILTILLMYCHQNRQFLSYFQSSDGENALKSGLSMMLVGKLIQGKSIILDWVHSQRNLPRTSDGTFNCHGTEFDMFLSTFCHVWRLHQQRQCDSKFCPSANSERSFCNFSLDPVSESDQSYYGQMCSTFPRPGDKIHGYCGSEFPSKPPSVAPQAYNYREDVTGTEREYFYECRGTPSISSSFFSSTSPWIIPFNISAIKGYQELTILSTTATDINVYNTRYCFGGFTMVKNNHLTAAIIWKGDLYYYDGMKNSQDDRFQRLEDKDFFDQEGSTLIYFKH